MTLAITRGCLCRTRPSYSYASSWLTPSLLSAPAPRPTHQTLRLRNIRRFLSGPTEINHDHNNHENDMESFPKDPRNGMRSRLGQPKLQHWGGKPGQPAPALALKQTKVQAEEALNNGQKQKRRMDVGFGEMKAVDAIKWEYHLKKKQKLLEFFKAKGNSSPRVPLDADEIVPGIKIEAPNLPAQHTWGHIPYLAFDHSTDADGNVAISLARPPHQSDLLTAQEVFNDVKRSFIINKIDHLRSRRQMPHVAIIGGADVGKRSIVKLLARRASYRSVKRLHELLPHKTDRQRTIYGLKFHAIPMNNADEGCLEVIQLPAPDIKKSICDPPMLGAMYRRRRWIRGTLLVANALVGGVGEREKRLMKMLASQDQPFVVVLNKAEIFVPMWNEPDFPSSLWEQLLAQAKQVVETANEAGAAHLMRGIFVSGANTYHVGAGGVGDMGIRYAVARLAGLLGGGKDGVDWGREFKEHLKDRYLPLSPEETPLAQEVRGEAYATHFVTKAYVAERRKLHEDATKRKKQVAYEGNLKGILGATRVQQLKRARARDFEMMESKLWPRSKIKRDQRTQQKYSPSMKHRAGPMKGSDWASLKNRSKTRGEKVAKKGKKDEFAMLFKEGGAVGGLGDGGESTTRHRKGIWRQVSSKMNLTPREPENLDVKSAFFGLLPPARKQRLPNSPLSRTRYPRHP